MAQEIEPPDTPQEESLGIFLSRHREAMNATIEDVYETTKISTSVIKAIENEDHTSLPADVFVRGFLTLYANFLQLDPDTILQLYAAEKSQPKDGPSHQSQPPVKKGEKVQKLAKQSQLSGIISRKGLILLILALLAGLVFFWFQDNSKNQSPAPESPQQTDQSSPDTIDTADQTVTKSPAPALSPPKKTATESETPEDAPPTPTLSPQEKTIKQDPETTSISQPDTSGQLALYTLQLTVPQNTVITLEKDDLGARQYHLKKEKTYTWNANQNLRITLPSSLKAKLVFNGNLLSLPQTTEETMIISLPEYLLDT